MIAVCRFLHQVRKAFAVSCEISSVVFLSNIVISSPLMAQNVPIPSASKNTQLTLPSGTFNQLIDISPEQELSWIDRTEQYFANTVHDFGTYIDHGIAKQEDEETLTNQSYVQLRSMAEYSHRGYFGSDSKVSVRIDLPHAERRWKLIFETDPDDYDTLESKQRDVAPKATDSDENKAIGGFRFQDGLLRNWDTSFDIGVRIKLPMDPFVRTELRRAEDFLEDRVVQFKQQLFYYHSIGAGLLSDLRFYVPVDEDVSQIFTAGSSAQYIYDDRRWELVFQLGLSERINDDQLLEYSTGISVDPEASDEINNSWISVAWHKNVYKNWLYLSVIPRIDAPREYGYKANPGGQLKLEVFFSKNKNIDRINRAIPTSTRKDDRSL